MKYFFVGINGSGMSALASIVRQLDNEVYGYDYNCNLTMEYDNNYLYVIGNFFKNSPIFTNIKDMGLNYIMYQNLIDTLFDNINICVSGTHGKTTTTKMISSMVNCSYLIGDKTGHVNKESSVFVYEGCEYQDTFLAYHPTIGVITNCDYDHVDYFNSVIDVFNSFKKFSKQCEVVFVNGDDPYLTKLEDNVIKFGKKLDNDIIFNEEETSSGYDVTINYYGDIFKFSLALYGIHMVYNFVASYCVARYLGNRHEVILNRFKNYKNPKRRFEQYFVNDCIYIHDYAHHPTEIKAIYNSVRQIYSDLDMCVVFQPHTYSRIIKLKELFKESLMLFDKCYMLDVYNSREQQNLILQKNVDDYFGFDKFSCKCDIKKYPIVLFLGAGDIYNTFKKCLL